MNRNVPPGIIHVYALESGSSTFMCHVSQCIRFCGIWFPITKHHYYSLTKISSDDFIFNHITRRALDNAHPKCLTPILVLVRLREQPNRLNNVSKDATKHANEGAFEWIVVAHDLFGMGITKNSPQNFRDSHESTLCNQQSLNLAWV